MSSGHNNLRSGSSKRKEKLVFGGGRLDIRGAKAEYHHVTKITHEIFLKRSSIWQVSTGGRIGRDCIYAVDATTYYRTDGG